MDAFGTSDIFLFEPFRLDRRGLFRREEGGGFVPLNLGSRAAEILRILVERAGELVPKEEIIATVWPGTVVEDSNLTVQISALRRSLDEQRAERSYIQTVPGRGYRFVATVTRLQPSGATESASEAMAGGLDLAFLDLGEQQVKNIARPFRVGTHRARAHSKPGAAPTA
jgi:DNA-binding winged helix-turn-helix (wHTH) protein